ELDLTLQRFDHFGERVIFVNVKESAELNQLHSDLKHFARTELRLLNEWNDMRGFHPHVTLAFRDLRRKNFQAAWDFISTKVCLQQFRVEGLSLLKHDQEWRELRYFSFKKPNISI